MPPALLQTNGFFIFYLLTLATVAGDNTMQRHTLQHQHGQKIADVFEVTIDFLIGNNHNLAVDKKTLKRMQDIDKLDEGTKDKLFFLIDNVIQNTKAKQAFAS